MKFRLQALVHQGQPDELDIVPRLVRPRALVAVATLAAVIIAAIVWSFVGELPRRVSARGILTPDGGLSIVQSTAAGVVQKVDVEQAHQLSAGDAVVTLVDGSGKSTSVSSPFDGQAITVSVTPGQVVQVGSPLATVLLGKPGTAGARTLNASLFVPASQAAQIAPGMQVQMAVDVVPQAAFGLLRGEVKSVEPFPLTSGQALGVVGNDLVVNDLLHGGPMRLVHVTLQADTTVESGYAWTTKNGPPFPLLAQSLLNASVKISSEHPINLVFGR